MKHIYFSAVFILLMAGCTSSKKLLQKGQYDALIQRSVKKLIKNPSSEEDAVMLDKAYNLANDRDLERLKYLRTENNPRSYDEMYRIYSNLKSRQTNVRKVLPLRIGGRTIQYEFVDYDKHMVEAKKKAADYYYDNATKLMNVNTKESYRQAYYEFKKAKDYMGNVYPDIDNHIHESRYLGTSRVLMSVVNNTLFNLPQDFVNNVITIDTREFSNEWVEFHIQRLDRETQYDYYVDLILEVIDISPDMASDRDYIEKKTIEDGFDYVLDSRGNVMKDSLGNDIKVKKYKDITCTVIETLQQKHCTIQGHLEFISLNPKQLLKKEPVSASTHFEHLSARAIGDINALKPETRKLIQQKRIPYPDDFGMIYDCTETMKLAIHDALKHNRSFIQ
ncbi:MAG: hypothetical protein JXR41_03275 [Bacteroidales bacterium]|nr:hypothetical protein [Bacteroidales bacterium]MBN2762087.1 hypothetical protein [Bacteroidales bacterium]